MTTLRKPPKPKRRPLFKGAYRLFGPLAHDPDDLCGGRRLQGREFQRRKAELEAASDRSGGHERPYARPERVA